MALFDDFNPLKFVPVGLAQSVFQVIQWSFVIGILLLLFYYLVWRRMKYRDEIYIYDYTGSGMRRKRDRGAWIKAFKDGTGYYGLLKDKKAKLKAPDQEGAFFTTKGKMSYDFVKFDDTGFGYYQVKSDMKTESERVKNSTEFIALADLDWGKMQIKREMEKKHQSWLNEHKGTIAIGGIIVVGLLSILWIVGFAQETLQLSYSETDKTANAIGEFADALDRYTNAIKGQQPATTNIVEAPEGF